MADNITVKDAGGTNRVVRAVDNTSVFLPAHALAKSDGTAFAPVDGTAGLKVDLGSDNDVVISDGGGSITVDGTVTANLSATDNAVLDAIDSNTDNIVDALAGEYETVAASQTGQTIGATGGTGDYLSHLIVIPATTSPGNVIILDNATSITVFTGGADSVSNLVPFQIPLGMYSASGAWSVTTGANVSVIAVGNFT